ncbi:hypothetical protein ACFL54_02795 [Planctomycetota bacterium]
MNFSIGRELQIKDHTLTIREILKEDFFNQTLLATGPGGEKYIYKHARFFGEFLPFRPMAMFFSRRERLAAIRSHGEGTPQVICFSARAYLMRYQEGPRLLPDSEVDDLFFDRLWDIIKRLHEQGVAHNDLHKYENFLITDEGKPFVMDFQLAAYFPLGRRFFWWPTRPLFKLLTYFDRYHIYKIKRRLRPDLLTPEEDRLGTRSVWHKIFFKTLVRPYLIVKRTFIPAGSNDRFWFQVKQKKANKEPSAEDAEQVSREAPTRGE